jgi:excisionase family DNA binding protein
VTIYITLRIGGQPLRAELDDVAVAAIAAVLPREPEPVASPYMTIPEAAQYLRCSRQRIDDLLSQRRLTRHKDGRRTLVRRTDIEAHLETERRHSTRVGQS